MVTGYAEGFSSFRMSIFSLPSRSICDVMSRLLSINASFLWVSFLFIVWNDEEGIRRNILITWCFFGYLLKSPSIHFLGICVSFVSFPTSLHEILHLFKYKIIFRSMNYFVISYMWTIEDDQIFSKKSIQVKFIYFVHQQRYFISASSINSVDFNDLRSSLMITCLGDQSLLKLIHLWFLAGLYCSFENISGVIRGISRIYFSIFLINIFPKIYPGIRGKS